MSLKSLLSLSDRPNQIARTEPSPFSLLQREIDRVLSDFTRGWPTLGTDLTPRMDVSERENEIQITAELPGLEEKDVEVTLADDVLTIRCEKKAEREEKDENRHIVERSYGSFSRSVRLPEGIKPEDIKASIAKGVLTVKLPKPAQAMAEAKKIEVKAAA